VFRKYLSMIQAEAFRCKEITSKLLDFSRVGEVQCQATNLGELVKDVIELIETIGEYQDKQLTFSGSMSVFALANPHQIKQVALNLIVNGLHAIEPGGQVTVEVTQAGGMAQLVIADNGCGMTDEVRRHLFEPFFTRKAIGQGTGLGLSIAYRIVTDHKGTIDVHSPGPNQGSRFVVKLPLARSNEEVHHRNAQAA
ncbi:MAG: HAMP domain-containing histidine kinase, partial [Planctomycetaceae bacterium]|nr:HAMP domain-containing histidine kinase [Planctomycetaceae bacterium]